MTSLQIMTSLQNLSDDDLNELRTNVDAEISNRISAKKELAIQKILAVAKAANLDLRVFLTTEPMSNKKKRQRMKPGHLYQNPDTSAIWYGRGRKPNWIVNLLKEGHTLESLKKTP